jgi:hypothetical protein
MSSAVKQPRKKQVYVKLVVGVSIDGNALRFGI